MDYGQISMPPDAPVSPSKYLGGRERRKGRRNVTEENAKRTIKKQNVNSVNKQDKTLKNIDRQRERVTPAKREILRVHRINLISTSFHLNFR